MIRNRKFLGRHSMFVNAVTGSKGDFLFECYRALSDLLSKCLGQPVGIGFDILALRSDIPVPATHATALSKLSRELHRFGGKFRFRVKKRSTHMIKDYVDLYKRVVDRIFPLVVCNKGVCSLLRAEKPRKIDVTKPGKKRTQKYTYSWRWNHDHVRTLLVNATDSGLINCTDQQSLLFCPNIPYKCLRV